MTRAKDEYSIAGISINKKTPTKFSFNDLYTWVIWQYPKQKNKGLCGAVRPPIPDHGWLPAIILVKEKSVEIYGHQDTLFPSPELAAEYFNNNGIEDA